MVNHTVISNWSRYMVSSGCSFSRIVKLFFTLNYFTRVAGVGLLVIYELVWLIDPLVSRIWLLSSSVKQLICVCYGVFHIRQRQIA